MKPLASFRNVISRFYPSLLFCLAGCSIKSNPDDKVLNLLNESIEASSAVIEKTNEVLLLSMEMRKTEPGVVEKATIIYEKAERVKMFSRACIKYIEGLKEMLTKTQKGDVNGFFIRKEKGEELYNTLLEYQKDVLSADTSMKKEFAKSFILASIAFDTTINKNFTDNFFKNTSAEQAIMILSKFQNNIYVNENRLLSFLNSRIAYSPMYPESFTSAFIMQNSSCFLPGEFIEITAGAGSIAYTLKPTVKIRNKKIDLSNGLAISKTRVPSKPGKYSAAIEVSYYDENGLEKTVTKKVLYTVIDTMACYKKQ